MNKEEFIRRSGEVADAAREISAASIVLMQGEEAIAANLNGDLPTIVTLLIGACETNPQFKLLFRAFVAAWADPEIRAGVREMIGDVVERPVKPTSGTTK